MANRRRVGAVLALAHATGCGGGSDAAGMPLSDATVEEWPRARDGSSTDVAPQTARPGEGGAADAGALDVDARAADREGPGRDASVDAPSTPAPRPTALLITPQHASVPQYGTVTLKVTAFFPDNTTEDVTQQARLTSNDAGLLSVRGSLITGLRGGTGTITATAFGLLATATIEVNIAAPTVAVRSLSLECGADHKLRLPRRRNSERSSPMTSPTRRCGRRSRRVRSCLPSVTGGWDNASGPVR